MRMCSFRSVLCHCLRGVLSFTLLLGVTVTGPVALAQMESAAVLGRITDQSGAVIRGATVKIREIETNVTATASTNTEGFYAIHSLRPGRYVISVQKQGFKAISVTGINLNVQDNLVRNFALQIGAVSESITIEAQSGKVNTTDASVSTVIDRKFVETVPLNGRSLQPLITLTPGVVMTPVTTSEQGQFSINGQRSDANYFTVDGVSANFGVSASGYIGQSAAGSLPASNAFGGTNSLVSIDAIQEFRIQTSSYAPEFGRTPGGQVSIVTRSGTNQYHGTLFEYFRNDVLDASDWFVNFNHLPKPPERQNDFGATLGGRILKDRTFFFFSYEGLRLRQPASGTATYPTEAFRQSPAAAWIKPLLDGLPIPNGAISPDGCTASTPSGSAPCDAQFHASYSNPTTLNATSIRIDHKVNDWISVFGRYNYAPSETSQRVVASNSILNSRFPMQTATVGSTQTFSPRIGNEFRVNYSLASKNADYVLDNLGGAVPPSSAMLFPSGFSSQNTRFELQGLTFGNLLVGTFPGSEQRQFNIVDSVTLLKGAHQLKFGGDYRHLSTSTASEPFVQTVEFLDLGTDPFGVQSGGINFYVATAHANYDIASQNFSLYAQDTWKLKPRVTLTYGLRWDVNPPFQATGAPGIFTVQNVNDPANLALAPQGTPFYSTTWHNVAPRLGLAAQLSTHKNFERVLRAGFGQFYDLGAESLAQAFAAFPNRQENDLLLQHLPFPLPSAVAAPPPFTTTIPKGGISQIYAAEPDLQLPRIYQWNVALEQSLGGNDNVTVSYVGATDRDLLRTFTLFRPNPSFVLVNVLQNSATSDYHALQVQYQRQLKHGLQALAFYSWSHSIDDASNDSSTFGSNAELDRGNSDFDIRHSFHGAMTYSIPTPQIADVGRAILGHWSLTMTGVVQSAPPIDLKSGSFILLGAQDVNARPNIVPGQPFYLFGAQCFQPRPAGFGQPCPGGKGINPNAFVAPPKGQQGNLGRNVLRGFGLDQLDASVRRDFNITERCHLQFSAEFFNIFNHPNFGTSSIDPNLNRVATFGLASQALASSLSPGQGQGGFNPLYQVGGSRSIQLILKVTF
jgi:hypothetical protein